ncbi:unnamed protein product [Ilex paraguariensis]|uniref:Uncharacterized protein n=1 Tax=Ilex paraguariensis TaxID=185542 RepID=A0ABC8S2H4_9AQUA
MLLINGMHVIPCHGGRTLSSICSKRRKMRVFSSCVSELHVMMTKNEQVEECIGAAPVLQHAEVALPVCVLDAKSVVLQTAAARLALTSQGMRKLEVQNNYGSPIIS